MAKLSTLPEQAVIDGYKGKVDFYEWMGIPVARKWPRSPGKTRSSAVEAQWPIFSVAAKAWPTLPETIRFWYEQMASDTGLTGRDMFMRSYISGLYPYPTP